MKKTTNRLVSIAEYLLYGVIFAAISTVASFFGSATHSYVPETAHADAPATGADTYYGYVSDGDSGGGGGADACDGSGGTDDGCSDGAP